jgi:hypothetical protein
MSGRTTLVTDHSAIPMIEQPYASDRSSSESNFLRQFEQTT